MTANVGSLDRLVRLVVGLALIALPFVAGFASTLWTLVSVILGLVMLVVATTRFCPLYTLFGLKTCRS